MLHNKNRSSKLRAILVIAILAASASQMNNVLADDVAVSGNDMLDQAVALYEKLYDGEVQIPEQLFEYEMDEHLLKSVALGYANLDEVEEVAAISEVRKQDVMSLLYKTVINYDSSYIISDEEATDILNECCDNAYIDEENRLAYAFMLKQGIIASNVNTEPNKVITWDSCRILVDLVYDYFVQNVAFNVNDTIVTIGANIDTVTSEWGEPVRVDKSDYGFVWYVYNLGNDLCMVGVEGGRICGLFTNAQSFDCNGEVFKGDSQDQAQDVLLSQNIRIIYNNENKADSILYTSRENGHEADKEVEQNRVIELLDIINSYRAQNDLDAYVLDVDLSNAAWMKNLEAMDINEITEDGLYGADIYSVYGKLLKMQSTVLVGETKRETAIGIDTMLGDKDVLYASFVVDESVNVKDIVNQSDEETDDFAKTENVFGIIPTVSAENGGFLTAPLIEDDEISVPVIKNDAEMSIDCGEDIVLDIQTRAANEYLLEVYDSENENYLVNSYIKADNNKVNISSDILQNGVDYNITLSAVNDEGEKKSAEDILVSYGDATQNGVEISIDGGKTENDYIPLEWTSEQYHDFYVDVYNSNGDLIISKIFEDEYEALIQGLDPDTYYVYVTALKKGTTIEKAQDTITVEIVMPEPVINEYILDKDDKYYFVYEDDELGVLYFYDEEIVEVYENGKKVNKKKIIQKQVKSTKAYRQLAKYQRRIEYITGEPVKVSYLNVTGNAIVSEAMKYIGVPYVWGGATPEGFDCSGLVQYVCKSLGINVDRVTHEQVTNGVKVERHNLQPGDLVFFKNDYGYIGHVGIYVGENKFLHAPNKGDVVKITELSEEYYDTHYYEARRVY